MSSGDIGQLIILLILLSLSAFFSASETALMSLSKIRIRHMTEEKIKGADLVYKLVNNPNKLLGAILVGNNIVNIGASALATSLAIRYFGNTGVGIATGIMTILVLIFAEITPKSLAAQNAEKMSLRVARPISLIAAFLSPVITVMIFVTNGIIKMLGGKVDKQRPFITEEELKTMINVSHEEGVLEIEERKMIHNIFEFGDIQVREVMIPRTHIVAVEVNTFYTDILYLFKKTRFSRLPVYRGKIDNIIGVLYLQDFIFIDEDIEKFDIEKYIREPYYTFEFKRISELFYEMQNQKIPVSIVLDEYGGTAGLVAMEDLVEEIVGEIQDGHDPQEDEIEIIKEDEFIIKGSTKIEAVNELIGVYIESEDFDSIGGFIMGLFGRLPDVGETIQHGGVNFIVENRDRNRIGKLRIIKLGDR